MLIFLLFIYISDSRSDCLLSTGYLHILDRKKDMTAYILYYYYYSLAAVEAESKIKHFRFVSGKVKCEKDESKQCAANDKPAAGWGLSSLGLCTTLAEAPPIAPPEGWPLERGVGGSNATIHWLIRDSRSTVVRTDSDRMDIRWPLVCWAASL